MNELDSECEETNVGVGPDIRASSRFFLCVEQASIVPGEMVAGRQRSQKVLRHPFSFAKGMA
jgi:hypothetical protein